MRASLPLGKQDKEFQKKPQLALSLVDWSLARGERPGIVLIDAGYGNSTTFLKELENRQLKYLGGIAKNREVRIEKQDKSLAEILVDKWAESLYDQASTQIKVKLDKAKQVWVATRQVEFPGQSGKRTTALVMNAKNFNDASDIDYFITNVESQKATGEWFVKTYSHRNRVEVFYRETKGWLGLKEYQVRDARSLMRHFILVFCDPVAHLNRGIKKKVGDETFKQFCRSFVGLSNSHILSICLVAQSQLGRVCCLQKEFDALFGLDFCLSPNNK